MGPIDYSVILAVGDGEHSKTKIGEVIEAALERVNQRMSTYIEDSDVSKFNRHSGTDWFSVDLETAKVVKRALEMSVASNGAFDISVGPAVKLWNFGPGKKRFEVPSDDDVEKLKGLVGFKNISVRTEPPSLRKAVPGLQIDLSAIAKGYAVDCVANYVSSLGYQNFMVIVGGGSLLCREKRKRRLGYRNRETERT